MVGRAGRAVAIGDKQVRFPFGGGRVIWEAIRRMQTEQDRLYYPPRDAAATAGSNTRQEAPRTRGRG